MVDKAMEKATHFKHKIKSMIKKIDSSIDVTEKELRKVLVAQLATAKKLLQEHKVKFEERASLVSSINEVYDRVRKLFIDN